MKLAAFDVALWKLFGLESTLLPSLKGDEFWEGMDWPLDGEGD